MNIFKSCIIAFSMYSKVPMPQIKWEEKDMRYAICFFPGVGLVIGVICWLWMLLCQYLPMNMVTYACILALIPLVVSGGIHIDGFMDASDALHSYQEKSRKLEILKDSHIGAFAVIMLAGYYLLYVSALACITEQTSLILALGFCLSRVLSGTSVVYFNNAKLEGTLFAFSSTAHKKAVRVTLALEFILCVLGMVWVDVITGCAVTIISLVIFFYYRYKSYKEFGGITGDLAGWFLCICELGISLTIAVTCICMA